jgi:hypothetical protein
LCMVDVFATDEFEAWFDSLDKRGKADVVRVVGLLELFGVQLEYPHSSSIKKSDAIRELRPRRGKSPLRVFYTFDPRRDAVLLVGGEKSPRLYGQVVAVAERIFGEYLAEQRAGKHDETED